MYIRNLFAQNIIIIIIFYELQMILMKFYLHDIKFNNKALSHLIILFCIKFKKRK